MDLYVEPVNIFPNFWHRIRHRWEMFQDWILLSMRPEGTEILVTVYFFVREMQCDDFRVHLYDCKSP